MAKATKILTKGELSGVTITMSLFEARQFHKHLGDTNFANQLFSALGAALNYNAAFASPGGGLTVTPVLSPDIERYTLELSPSEIGTIASMSVKVAGDPEESRRALSDGIYKAIRIATGNDMPITSDITGGLNFLQKK
jgi:hypothetical protein